MSKFKQGSDHTYLGIEKPVILLYQFDVAYKIEGLCL